MDALIASLNRLRALGLTERTWFNAIWFQSTWFFCVLGREMWLPAALTMVGMHFLLVDSARRELKRLAPLIAIGIVVDSLLSAVGIFDFGGVLIPSWLCVLWIAFAAAIPRALAVFGRHPIIAALVGGIGVPFNYAAGAQFGAVTLPLDPLITGAILVSVWTVLLPALYWIALPTTRRSSHEATR